MTPIKLPKDSLLEGLASFGVGKSAVDLLGEKAAYFISNFLQ